MNGVPILMYHSIGGSGRLAVPAEAFAEQMAWLAAGGFTPLAFGDLVAGRRAARPVVITFDDGYADQHDRALPVLARYGFPATVFITPGWLRDAGGLAAGRAPGPMMSWAQAREVAAGAGIEIGAHSISHTQLDQLPDAELRDELVRSKGVLEDRLGRAVTTMAYPYGYSSSRVRREARAAGYAAACVVGNALPSGRHDVFALPRLTVRATTSLTVFARVVEGRAVARTYLPDHLLTKGYAVVRRTRFAARWLRGAA